MNSYFKNEFGWDLFEEKNSLQEQKKRKSYETLFTLFNQLFYLSKYKKFLK